LTPASKLGQPSGGGGVARASSGWNKDKAVDYLNSHANNNSLGRCAEYTRRAIEAGGVKLTHHTSAKDYGSSLLAVGFESLGHKAGGYRKGDVGIVQPIKGHPHGHMAMYNGVIWISDFRQFHGLYPGPGYRAAKPMFTIYRYPDPDSRPLDGIKWDAVSLPASSNMA